MNKLQRQLDDALIAREVRRDVVAGLIPQFERRIEQGKGDESGLTGRGLVGTYLKAGDLCGAQGQRREAADFYRQGDALAEKLQQAHPDSDKAAGNRAALLIRLARVAAVEKKPAEALRLRQQALELQQQVLGSPKSGEVPPVEAKASVAGTLEELGDHARALKLREEVVQARPTSAAKADLATA